MALIDEPLSDEPHVLFTTYRRAGTPVSSPVWITTFDASGRVGFYTTYGAGKTKRLRHTKRVSLQPCSMQGKLKAGTSPVNGTAVMVRSGADFDAVKAAIRSKYGARGKVFAFMGKLAMKRKGLSYADTVVLVTLDASEAVA